MPRPDMQGVAFHLTRAAGAGMDHGAAHGDGVFANLLRGADFTQGLNAANGKGEIDGTAALGVLEARIGALFMEIDSVAGLAEIAGQERAGEAGADDGKL